MSRERAPASVFRLNASDKDSATWRRIAARISERIERLRQQLEKPQPEDSTAVLRGRIAELRLLASAADEEIPPPLD